MNDMPAQTQTHLFLCLKDNYGVLLHDPESDARFLQNRANHDYGQKAE
jgi:hypothetical protein